MLFKRQIRLNVLLSRGVCYRCFIVVMNLIFNLIAFKGLLSIWATRYFGAAVAYTIAWNIVNTCLYYLFHYVFDRNFKIGKER